MLQEVSTVVKHTLKNIKILYCHQSLRIGFNKYEVWKDEKWILILFKQVPKM